MRIRPGALPRAARGCPGRRLRLHVLRRGATARERCSSATTSISRSTRPCGSASSRRSGRRTTYFLMTESVFYNQHSSEGTGAATRLRELGHRVGLHAVYPHASARRPVRRRVGQCFNPDPEYMTAPVDEAVNVMAPPYFAGHIARTRTSTGAMGARTTSCTPVRSLAPAADPPRDLGLRGATPMAETMRSLLETEHARRVDRRRADRIDIP